MQYKIICLPGEEKYQPLVGRTLVLMDIGEAANVDLVIHLEGYQDERINGVRAGLKVRLMSHCTGVTLISQVQTTVMIFCGFADMSVNYVDGANVKAEVTNTVTANIQNPEGNGSEILDTNPIAVTDVPTLIFAANPARKSIRMYNSGNPDSPTTGPAAIGGAGVNWDKSAVAIWPGEGWEETIGQKAAWYAVCPAGKSTWISVQEVR